MTAREAARESDSVVLAVPLTGDRKTGRMSATYAPISRTCPASCELRQHGECYATLGRVGLVARRLEGPAAGMRARDVSRAEAAAIDGLFGGRPVPPIDGSLRMLRIHISGDAREQEGARALGAAASRWVERGGGQPYTYTHAWASVPREAWGPDVSVMGSCDRREDAPEARAAGYAPACVVAEHPADGRAWHDPETDTTWVPCPNQTRGVQCSDCGLCMRADDLRDRGQGVSFAAHGQRARKLRLRIIERERPRPRPSAKVNAYLGTEGS